MAESQILMDQFIHSSPLRNLPNQKRLLTVNSPEITVQSFWYTSNGEEREMYFSNCTYLYFSFFPQKQKVPIL